MTRYIALLRGINVGGNNIIKMSELRTAFERRGFQNVSTYINSGNVIFHSNLDEPAVKSACEALIAEGFGMDIPVCVISAAEMTETIAQAPVWWNQAANTKHNAFFVIPPMTPEEIYAHVGAVNEECEKAAFYGRVIFWSAPKATFSRTRWSRMLSKDNKAYHSITVRNANTALKLAELAGMETG